MVWWGVLPGDEFADGEGMSASILHTEQSMQEAISKLSDGSVGYVPQDSLGAICHAARGFTLVYRLLEEQVQSVRIQWRLATTKTD